MPHRFLVHNWCAGLFLPVMASLAIVAIPNQTEADDVAGRVSDQDKNTIMISGLVGQAETLIASVDVIESPVMQGALAQSLQLRDAQMGNRMSIVQSSFGNGVVMVGMGAGNSFSVIQTGENTFPRLLNQE